MTIILAWQSVGALGITHGLLVPTMIDMLLEQGALRHETLRVLQYGSTPRHCAAR